MKIGFVAEPYEETHTSGMGYAVLETMRNVPRQGPEHEYVYFSSQPISRELVPVPFTNIIVPRGLIKKLIWFWRLKGTVDVLLYTAPLLPLVVPRVRTIMLCKELGSQKIRPGTFAGRMSDFVRDHVLMPFSLRSAAHLLVPSQATKDDLVHFYKVSPERISVVYEGPQDMGEFAKHPLPIDPAMQPYFFAAGKVKPRKNIHGIVAAFIEFVERTGAKSKLVIAGDYGGSYYEEMVRLLEEHHLRERVFFLGYIPGGLLYSLYKNSLAFVFPSLNEGFGMPIVEAFMLGTPVITSNISSTAEVAADAALLVDPYDLSEISRAMERALDPAVRRELVGKGAERAKLFSWPATAKGFLEVIEKVCRQD